MSQLQVTELTGASFGFVDTFLYCCSSVKIDCAISLLPNFEDVNDQPRTACC